ncbi:MAG TPA: glycosyltransferase family 1 protein [Bryobacteraceae bacterium]|nr:glycosyltransferase family 1 protein [Bryobacteraceae bacterium]
MAAQICVDCSPLLVRSAGVKTYLHHWIAALRALHPDAVQTFLEPSRRDLDHGGGIRHHPARLAALQTLRRMPAGITSLVAPRCDVFHASSLLGSRLSLGLARRSLLSATIHDMTAWTVPWCHLPRQVDADKEFADRVMRRADGLIAVSESARQDAIRVLGTRPEKIRVVYPGVAGEYFRVTREQALTAIDAYHLAAPYFLFVGTIEPRKNVDTLLSAWMSLPVPFRRENELVFIGMPGWKAEKTLRRLAQLSCESSGVRYLGYVPESLVPGLIAGALALVCPSYYEGFGFPAAQAMAAGCPVIGSNVASLPEITAGHARLVDPHSSGELAQALRDIQESPHLRQRLSRDGRQRARVFNWEESAANSFHFLSNLRN